MPFVSYHEYEPPIRPAFEDELNHVIDNMVRRTRESPQHEPTGRAVRAAHAKTYGLARASVTVLDDLPAEYAQGIYGQPRTYDAVVRYSNGLAHIRPDPYLGAACGMGIKIFDVPGPSLLDDERDATTFDYNLINNSTFFCNTIHDYVTIEPLFAALPGALAQEGSRRQWLYDFLTDAGSLPPEKWLWDELTSVLSFTSIHRQNLVTYTYWSMGALRHGDHIAKIRAVPTDSSLTGVTHREVDVVTDSEAFRSTLVAEVGERDHHFDLQVQLCADLTSMPVDNTSREWSQQLSPFVTVARVDIPRQDISDPRNIDIAEQLSITPWRVRAEHQPLGEIMEVRREVYRQSSFTRHQVNDAPRREPAGLDELFG